MVIYRHAFHFVFNLIIVEKRLFQNFRKAISDYCDSTSNFVNLKPF